MPYCPNCSCSLLPHEGECPNCGAVLSDKAGWKATSEPTGPIPPRPAAVLAPAAAPAVPLRAGILGLAARPWSRKSKFIALFVALVLLLPIGCLLLMFIPPFGFMIAMTWITFAPLVGVPSHGSDFLLMAIVLALSSVVALPLTFLIGSKLWK